MATRFPLGTPITRFIFREARAAMVKKPLYSTPRPFASATNSIFCAARTPFVGSLAKMTMTVGARKKKK